MSAAPDEPRRTRDGVDGGASSSWTPELRTALRTARVDEAERASAVADLQGIAHARLELLRDRLEPVMAQVPADIDIFDMALSAGTHPRLFIDMIAFVEMAQDRRRYRFFQDTREGRLTLCDTDRVDAVAEAVTVYVARRLVERDKALASCGGGTPAWRGTPAPIGRLRRAWRVGLEYLGLASLVVLLWVAGHMITQWVMTMHR